MITKEMVIEGYQKGLIELITSPNSDGTACQIGDNWFYFGGITAEEYDDVENYKNSLSEEVIIQDIWEVLNDFQTNGFEEFEEEALYYEYFLNEHGIGLAK